MIEPVKVETHPQSGYHIRAISDKQLQLQCQYGIHSC